MPKNQREKAWFARVEEHQASGESVKVWCERNQVKPDRLYYWSRKYAEATGAKPGGLQWLSVQVEEAPGSSHGHASIAVPPEASRSIRIKVGGATIEVDPGFDPALLATVVKTVQGLC